MLLITWCFLEVFMAVVDPFSIDVRTKTKKSSKENVFVKSLKKITLRKVLLKLHLYISLWLGAFLVLAGLTGSLLVYDHAIDKWLNNDLMVIREESGPQKPLLDLIAKADEASPIKSKASHLQLPSEQNEALIVRYQVPAEEGHKGHNHHFYEVMMNPFTGETLGGRDRYYSLMSTILKLHFNLLVNDTGKWIMGITALMTLFLTITGIYLWWPKLSKLKQALSFKKNASFIRFNFDLHKTVGFYTSIVIFTVALSGVYFNLPMIFRPVVNYFSPLDGMMAPVKSESSTGNAIKPEDVLSIAQQQFPGITVQRIFLPATNDAAYQISGRQQNEIRHKGSTMLWVDQYSGKVLRVKDPNQFTAGNAFINIQLPLHNGEILGEVGRILVAIAGFAPLILMVTGVIHWLKKKRPSRAIKQVCAK